MCAALEPGFVRRSLLAWGAVVGLAAGAGAQEVPPEYEQGLFQLNIEDLTSQPIPMLVAPDGTLLFPMLAILRVADIPVTGDSAGFHVFLLSLRRIEIDARVDTVARRIIVGSLRVDAEPGTMLRAEGDVYLSPPLLAALLGASIETDFGTLELRIEPHVPMPAQLAVEAERRRQLAQIRAGHGAGAPSGSAPLRPLSGGGVLHYSLSSAYPRTSSATALTLESGFALAGGLGALGYSFSSDQVAIDPRLTFRYERFIPERPWISFVRAGDIVADAAFFRSIRGATVTNRPLRREGHFQDILIDPEVPPGYEIEVYQGGQLIAYSDRATQDPIRVPLTYGRTDLEVRMIAPSGQVVSTGLLYGVPQTQLPADAFEYSAGAGACHVEECTLGFLTGDYGVRNWLTLGAGYEAEHDSTGTEHLPFARASVSPAGGWLGEARVIGDRQVSTAMQYNGPGAVTGSIGIDVRSAQVPRVTLLPQTRTRWDTRGELGFLGRRVTARLGGMEGVGVDRWGLGYIATIPRGVVIAQLESFTTEPIELSITAFRLLPQRLLGSTMTGSTRASTTRHGVNAVEAGASAAWGNALFANLTVGWDRQASFNLSLSFSRLLDVGQVAGVVVAADGVQRTTLRADGAVALDPFEALEPAAYTGVGFAGVDALVYRDLNGNGVRDADEPPAPGVSVQVGDRSATSDSAGHARVWGVIPWERTVLRASSDWFEPQWAPAEAQQVFRPVAHLFNPIDVPLIATREFIAYLVPGEGIPTTAGISFRLINERTGAARDGMTLSDGSIYISGLPAGPYALHIAEDDLAFLRARPVEPIRFEVGAADADQFVFELPAIVIERAGT